MKNRPYLGDMINDLERSGESKIHMTMKMSFSSPNVSNGEHLMHSKSDNEEIMIDFDLEEINEEFLHYLLQRYQVALKQPLKGIDFLFDYIHGLFHGFHRISPNCGGCYINSPKWLKNKKATINPKINNKCFQNMVAFALNWKKIENIQKDVKDWTLYKPIYLKINKFSYRIKRSEKFEKTAKQ